MSNTQNRSPNTGAVVVFFYPDASCVARANRLAASMRCVVVDNTPEMLDRAALGLTDSIEFIPNGWNAGVAMAFNQGVGALIRAGCDVALLFDQDSEPAPSLLTDLPKLIFRARESGSRVALVGPAYEDQRLRGVAPFVRFGWGRLERIPPVGDVPIDVDFLISSGSCINLECWEEIGAMDESLFIDFVDLEWCIRAKQCGYQVWGIPWLRMSHHLGGDPIKILGRPYPMHGPLRHYYQFRNVIALMKRASIPLKWKSTELVKLPFRVLLYCFFPERRGEHLVMVCRGIRDGLRGRLGPYSDRVK